MENHPKGNKDIAVKSVASQAEIIQTMVIAKNEKKKY